jgi:PAS domain S-box-containing protein
MTLATDSAQRTAAADAPARDDALLISRAGVGLGLTFGAIVLMALADFRLLHGDTLDAALLVRAAQFALIGSASFALRASLSWRARVAAMTAFIGALYATSAIAGCLRGTAASQPVTDLAIAFATATTLPWGPLPQLVSVVVALVAIVASAWVVDGSFAGIGPHMAAGVAIALLVSVYIAHQLQRYRRERDIAEAAVRWSEERFRSLIERGSDLITIMDAGGVIRYESPSLERTLGHRPEDCVGRPAMEYVHPDDASAVRAVFEAVLRGESAVGECRIRRREGSWCPVEVVFRNLLDHPAVGGIVANWRDISDRRRSEEERARYVRDLARARDDALASTRAKSLFLANVSHEIRTPLNVIIGMADMVLDSELDAGQRHDLGRARSAALGLLGIINDILDASKIEAGKMSIHPVDIDLIETIETAVAMLAPAAAAKALALGCDVARDVPRRVKGDPLRIRQTLINLVGNAVKFTDTGGIAVDVRVVRTQGTRITVRVTVADTGIGIPRDRQARIFESFAQGDADTTRDYGGTGLGLTISRELVALMGGELGVESEPGSGSTFWFELSLEAVADAVNPAAA